MSDSFLPSRNEAGLLLSTREEYSTLLSSARRKEPLFSACDAIGIRIPKNSTLERLRVALLDYWYPNYTCSTTPITPPQPNITLPLSLPSTPLQQTRNNLPLDDVYTTKQATLTDEEALIEEALIAEFDVDGAEAEEMMGYSDDDDELDEDRAGNNQEEDSEGEMDDVEFADFQRRTRVNEARRAESNRRPGGLKTQQAVVKAWKEFVDLAVKRGEIRDNIVDEHHLLLWIKHCAERPKKNRRGVDIPGTYLGASHIKKLYFGILRIRKEQDANDPTLTSRRPATTVTVWDALKSRMNESLTRIRNGLMPGEDAPDIVANTFLAGITDEQMGKVGIGFLSHSHLHSVINGHLAWTAQNASGNRGDDFRALKLCELQPYTFLHPNGKTAIPSILGLQGEEKAGSGRGMRTKINPVYTAFIVHVNPIQCPFGAFAFYQHYIHDVKDITTSMDIDWAKNSSWREIRVLHGPRSPRVPYNEQNLYNLYVKAFAKAGFVSHIKVHLPRHILGYNQERLGVSQEDTSKLGWVRGETFFDTYAPSLPKAAILGAHGYKVHETYDPVWRHVHVPEQFLQLVCPMAESIHSEIVGRQNLSGAANYWSLIISLRKYVFLCGAAIYQEHSESALFKLPALANKDVQAWMASGFKTNLALLKAKEGSPVDLQRIQNESLRLALEEVRSLLVEQKLQLAALTHRLDRRTAVFSPSKAFSTEVYNTRFTQSLQNAETQGDIICSDDTGVYSMADLGSITDLPNGDSGLRAFVNESPKTSPIKAPRSKTQVDLVLPPILAFSKPNQPQLMWPPVLGQRSVKWSQVYPLIERPEMLWECWGPRSLNSYSDLDELWTAYNDGECVYNREGNQTGIKPPIRQVELYFQRRWRKGGKERKAWERFREIPEYIEHASTTRGVSPRVVMNELDDLRKPDNGGSKLKGLSVLGGLVKKLRLEQVELDGISTDKTPVPGDRKRKAVIGIRKPGKRNKL